MGREMPPVPCKHGQKWGELGPPESMTQAAPHSVQRFCTARGRVQQRDRQTHRPRYIYALRTRDAA